MAKVSPARLPEEIGAVVPHAEICEEGRRETGVSTSIRHETNDMAKLHFMEREFAGHCWAIGDMLEDEVFRKSLVFQDSWYFLHYRFFGRDCVCSETSATVQTHLYDLASVIYRDFESLAGQDGSRAGHYDAIIAELVEICEYSSAFPVCLWAYGDETTREVLAGWLVSLPTPDQMAHVLKLPHMTRHEVERIPYRYSEPKTALKRYRNAMADYNRRRKLAAKHDQRTQTHA